MELTAIAMLRAILAGAAYPPPGITDTRAHRELWDSIAADVERMTAAGITPEVPADWADWAGG